METFENGAMLIEAVLMSFLVALWVTWMSLRGLFLMMPARKAAAASTRTMPRLETRGFFTRDMGNPRL